MEVSVIIPTMNRPKLLLRLIHYFDLLEFRAKILIGDSSSAENFQVMASALDNYRGRLNICHRHLPGRSVAAAVLAMNDYLTTPYACLIPDDDFLVPRTLANCIQFLDSHPDYVAAHGVGALISSSLGDSETIDGAGFYPLTTNDEATASARLSKHLASYSVSLFSVYRCETWRRMFINTPTPSEAPQSCDKSFADELLPCCLAVIYGRIKQIDGLYIVRQAHGDRYLLPTWFLWLTRVNWLPSYLYFRSYLAQALSIEDRIAISESENTVDRLFSIYLKRSIANKDQQLHWLRRFARKSLTLRSIWRTLNDVRDRIQPGRRLSLACLMSQASPYHDDFVPIFNAVTGGSAEAIRVSN